MKVCEICGEEIGTKDSENQCVSCDDREAWIQRNTTIPDLHTTEQRAKRNTNRRIRERILRDMGLIKVRGALGGTYWE